MRVHMRMRERACVDSMRLLTLYESREERRERNNEKAEACIHDIDGRPLAAEQHEECGVQGCDDLVRDWKTTPHLPSCSYRLAPSPPRRRGRPHGALCGRITT